MNDNRTVKSSSATTTTFLRNRKERNAQATLFMFITYGYRVFMTIRMFERLSK